MRSYKDKKKNQVSSSSPVRPFFGKNPENTFSQPSKAKSSTNSIQEKRNQVTTPTQPTMFEPLQNSTGVQATYTMDAVRKEIAQRKHQEAEKNNTTQTEQVVQLQSVDQPQQATQKKASSELGESKNNTGLSDRLKTGIENISGYSINDVKTHYTSNKPTQLQAHANVLQREEGDSDDETTPLLAREEQLLDDFGDGESKRSVEEESSDDFGDGESKLSPEQTALNRKQYVKMVHDMRTARICIKRITEAINVGKKTATAKQSMQGLINLGLKIGVSIIAPGGMEVGEAIISGVETAGEMIVEKGVSSAGSKATSGIAGAGLSNVNDSGDFERDSNTLNSTSAKYTEPVRNGVKRVKNIFKSNPDDKRSKGKKVRDFTVSTGISAAKSTLKPLTQMMDGLEGGVRSNEFNARRKKPLMDGGEQLITQVKKMLNGYQELHQRLKDNDPNATNRVRVAKQKLGMLGRLGGNKETAYYAERVKLNMAISELEKAINKKKNKYTFDASADNRYLSEKMYDRLNQLLSDKTKEEEKKE